MHSAQANLATDGTCQLEPLSKLRARNQMTEIRAADLRFTTEEATAFLGDVMGLALSAADVSADPTHFRRAG